MPMFNNIVALFNCSKHFPILQMPNFKGDVNEDDPLDIKQLSWQYKSRGCIL